jgi:hypothetical protein
VLYVAACDDQPDPSKCVPAGTLALLCFSLVASCGYCLTTCSIRFGPQAPAQALPIRCGGAGASPPCRGDDPALDHGIPDRLANFRIIAAVLFIYLVGTVLYTLGSSGRRS